MHKPRFHFTFICLYFPFHSICCVCLHANNSDNSSCVISLLGPKVSASLELCFSSQTAERGESAGVLCQRQQQWQRQRCWGHQDWNQSGHTTVTCGMHAPNTLFNIYLNHSRNDIINIPCTTSSPEQAELIVIRPRHSGGGLGPARWLRGVLAGAAEAAGGGAGGAGSGSTYGAHAGGGGKADPAAQTLTCGWLG